MVDALHLERGVGGIFVDLAVAYDLGVVAHALEEPVGDARRSAAAAGELLRARLGDGDPQYPRVADHDLLQVLRPVVVEPVGEPEAVEQRLGQQPFLVVAPTSVKRGRSILMVRAEGPWPRTMSIA